MMITEKIQQSVQKLPPSFQKEVLDFIEYLLAKEERENLHRENQMWSERSLTLAMQGMEDEVRAEFTDADLIEKF